MKTFTIEQTIVLVSLAKERGWNTGAAQDVIYYSNGDFEKAKTSINAGSFIPEALTLEERVARLEERLAELEEALNE